MKKSHKSHKAKIPQNSNKSEVLAEAEKKPRQSNIELLRIFAMLLIVTNHAIRRGLLMNLQFQSDVPTLLLQGFGFLGSVGNYLFVFISSWFLCDKEFSSKKVLSIWGELFFYSAAIAMIFYFSKIPCRLGDEAAYLATIGENFETELFPCDKKTFSAAFFPFFLSCSQWFVSCYILFYMISPFLNRMINAISQKEHILLVAFSVVYVTVVPMIPRNGLEQYASGNLVVFIMIFFVASYMKKYPVNVLKSARMDFVLAIVIFSLLVLWRITVVKAFAGDLGEIPFFAAHKDFLLDIFTSMRSFPILILCVLIFEGFNNIKMSGNKFINAVAASTLGVFLIHDNNIFRWFLWFRICHLPDYWGEKWFALYFIFIVLSVFAICTVIDFARHIAVLFIKKGLSH